MTLPPGFNDFLHECMGAEALRLARERVAAGYSFDEVEKWLNAEVVPAINAWMDRQREMVSKLLQPRAPDEEVH
jgi:hypothetical protein